MTTLLLRLAGPLQSWGTSSRFTRRATDRVPSKSGILGMLAAAQGRRRTDPLEELLDLRFAVRVEQEGQVERDFQTAARPGERTPISVSTRHYLADAVFLAAVEGDRELLEGLQEALRNPVFPIYLGRRSCPPAGKVDQGLRDAPLVEALTREPWLASRWFMKKHQKPTVSLEIVADASDEDREGADLVRDQPRTFDPAYRQWDWRAVVRCEPADVPNPEYVERPEPPDHHDPFGVL